MWDYVRASLPVYTLCIWVRLRGGEPLPVPVKTIKRDYRVEMHCWKKDLTINIQERGLHEQQKRDGKSYHLEIPSFFFFFFTLNPLLIRWFPYVGIFPNLLFHIIPFHSLPVALFIFLSPYFFFFPRPKASSSVIVHCRVSPKRATVWELGCSGETGLCWESPCCSFGPFYPEGRMHRGTDHKWYRRWHVET